MNSTRRSTIIKYALFTVIAIIVLVIFNYTRRAPTSDAQFRYNEWFTSVEVSLRPGTTAPPPITVSVVTVGQGIDSAHWEIRTGTNNSPDAAPQARDHMYRILQLIQESGVFGVTPVAEEDKVTLRYNLRVDHADHHFSISVPSSYVSGNIQAQNLVKLLQLYAATVPTTVAVPGQL